MTKLTNLNGETKTIDSREVAEMLGKAHGDLLKDIQGSGKNLGLIPVLTKGNFPVVDYFIESEYIDGKGETRKSYLVTKMGCEMLGNKQRGEKGILFTAKYVKRFNEMEEQVKQPQLPQDYLSALKALVASEEEKLKLKPKAESFDNFLSTEKTYTFTETAKTISTKFEEENVDIKLSAMKLTKFLRENGILNKSRTPNKKDIYGKVKNGRYNNLPNKAYEDYFNVIMMEGEHGTTQTRVKAKGVEFIYNLLKTNLN